MDAVAAEKMQLERKLKRILTLANKYKTANSIQQALLDLADRASHCESITPFFQALAHSISMINPGCQIVFWLPPVTGEEPEQAFSSDEHFDDQIENDVLHAFSSGVSTSTSWQKGLASRYFLSLPLTRGSQTMAVLSIYSDSPLSAEDIIRLTEFSQYVLLIMDRVRSRELIEVRHQRHSRRLSDLHIKLREEIVARGHLQKLTSALMSLSDLSSSNKQLADLLPTVHESIRDTMDVDGCSFAVQNKQNRKLDIQYFADAEGNPLKPAFSALKALQQVARTGKPTILQQSGSNTQWMACPFALSESSTGIISVQRVGTDRVFSEAEQTLLLFAAKQLAFTWQQNQLHRQLLENNEQLEEKIRRRTDDLHQLNASLTKQIDERKKVEEKLFHDAHHDTLTGLPNRAMFLDRLNLSLTRKRRHTSMNFAVLFIDLDRFKMINDTLGHQAGDCFLVEVSRRLQTCIRGNDILARLGGDEFVILLDMLQSTDDAEDIASRIIESLKQPFALGEKTIYSSASIGIALFDKRYTCADEILRDADAAMYQAKAFGRNRYVFFDESMREQLVQEMSMEQALREAVKNGQFEPHFQPINELGSKQVIGYEALLRWQHPELGNTCPDQFMHLAESTGLIIDIDRQTLAHVCEQLAYWQSAGQLESHTFISINLSGKHLSNPNATDKLAEVIRQSDVNPFHLILEFSENSLHQQGEQAQRALTKLHKLGVRLSLDNYGSGTSSLNFLHNYPFEFIKMDKSFIRALQKNPKHEVLISAIQALGEQMGFRLVAEGIETRQQYEKLIKLGCHYGQGYYLSHPKQLENKSEIEADDDIACA